MQAIVTLGRGTRVSLRLHWSVSVLAASIAVPMALVALPRAAPGGSGAGYAAAGAAIGVLVVASVFAHELAHAVTARAQRRRVERISLTLFGGSTEIADEPSTPRAELLISAAGPAMSLATGGVFLMAAGTGAALGFSELVPVSLVWLGITNVLLALLNLLPGISLDGGQVAVAALWRHSGNRDRARVTVRRAGLVLGVSLFALGAALVLGGQVHSGLLLAVPGWLVADPTGLTDSSAAVPPRNRDR